MGKAHVVDILQALVLDLEKEAVELGIGGRGGITEKE